VPEKLCYIAAVNGGLTMRLWIFFIVPVLLITGCSIKPRYEAPAPVVTRNSSDQQIQSPMQKPQSRTEGQVEITPLPDSPPPPMMEQPASVSSGAYASSAAQPAQNRAVELLQERAAEQVAKGDYASAAKSLERALSIEPNNARTWNQLAHLREKEKKYDIAAEIAARSNSLVSTGQDSLRKDNWLLISRARTQLGDRSGAEQARKQASMIN
jgi:tetratricopeptide (TPR) repeat protein